MILCHTLMILCHTLMILCHSLDTLVWDESLTQTQDTECPMVFSTMVFCLVSVSSSFKLLWCFPVSVSDGCHSVSCVCVKLVQTRLTKRHPVSCVSCVFPCVMCRVSCLVSRVSCLVSFLVTDRHPVSSVFPCVVCRVWCVVCRVSCPFLCLKDNLCLVFVSSSFDAHTRRRKKPSTSLC